MPHKYLFRLSLNGRFRRGTIGWSPTRVKSIVFFASLLEKIKHLSATFNKRENFNPLRIVLADDDEDDRQLFEEAISRIDPVISVEIAKNGKELITRMEKGDRPEIIFLDLNMPGKSGKECLMEIRQHAAWKDIPVIIYSTSSNKKDILDTYTGGANLYLLKPTSFRDLIRSIQKAFSFDWEQIPRLPQNNFVLTHLT